MPKYISGRVQTNPPTGVATDRYQFLDPADAEPNLGVPVTDNYVLSSDVNGNRVWRAETGGTSIVATDGFTVKENGVVAGVAGSISSVDFRDANNNLVVTTAPGEVGSAVTVRLNTSVTFTELNVTGVSTFSQAVNSTNGLDVTGHTELDSLNVSGIGTFDTLDVQTQFDVYDPSATFHNDVVIQGNLTVNGTETIINVTNLNIQDKDLVLGIGTAGDSDPTDDTANHGGIAIASTEGTPLVPFQVSGINTLPDTYKQFMWVKGGTYGFGTGDAWLTNYAVGVGSTLVPTGTYFAAGAIQFTEKTIKTPQLVVSGVSTFQNNVSIAGSISIPDNTIGDNNTLFLGNDGDLRLYHNGTISAIRNSTGELLVGGNVIRLQPYDLSETYLLAQSNAGVDLYYDNSKTFETTAYGIDVTGTTGTDGLAVSGVSTFTGDATFQGNVNLGDNDKFMVGDSNDLQIYHNGSTSYITDVGSGELNLGGSVVNIRNAGFVVPIPILLVVELTKSVFVSTARFPVTSTLSWNVETPELTMPSTVAVPVTSILSWNVETPETIRVSVSVVPVTPIP